MQEKATGNIVSCHVPFVYNGKAYYGCTDAHKDDNLNNQLWCSTKTNSSTYEHINGSQYWGICKDSTCMKEDCTTNIGNISFERTV